MNITIYLFQLVCSPDRLLDNITQDALRQEGTQREQHIRDREGIRIQKIRKAYWASFKMTVGAAIASIAVSILVNLYCPFENNWILTLKVASSLLIAWAVLGKLDRGIRSWGEESIPEQLNSLVFRVSYFLGVMGAVTSMLLKPQGPLLLN